VKRGDCIRKIQKYSSRGDDFVQIACEFLEKLENEEFELMAIVPEEFGYAKLQWYLEENSPTLPNL